MFPSPTHITRAQSKEQNACGGAANAVVAFHHRLPPSPRSTSRQQSYSFVSASVLSAEATAAAHLSNSAIALPQPAANGGALHRQASVPSSGALPPLASATNRASQILSPSVHPLLQFGAVTDAAGGGGDSGTAATAAGSNMMVRTPSTSVGRHRRGESPSRFSPAAGGGMG